MRAYRQNLRFLILLLVLTSGPLSLCAQGRPVQRPAGTENMVIAPPPPALVTHGIGIEKSQLLSFLADGPPKSVDPTKWPVKPEEKCQLAIDAMARLAVLQAKDAVEPLMRIASGEMPAGVQFLLNNDLANTSPEARQEFSNRAVRLLRYNAAIALGALHDPQAIPVIRNAFDTESSIAAKIQIVLALAALGDPAGIDYLVEVISQQNRRESAGAAKVFYYITGQDFGYTVNTPARARRTRAAAYKDWWKQNRSTFQLDTAAVDRRKSEPTTPVAFQPRNTRDLVKLSTFYLDFDNSLNTKEARERIAAAGTAINGDLEKIATNPDEDLDVRMEAANWYYEINRQDSKRLLRKLMRDENPEVVEKAKHLLDQAEGDAQPSPSPARTVRRN